MINQPKCLECDFFNVGDAMSDEKIFYKTLKQVKYCKNPDAIIYDQDERTKGYPMIDGRETKSSPKWCPLRST